VTELLFELALKNYAPNNLKPTMLSREIITFSSSNETAFFIILFCNETPNGLRHRPRAKRVGYLRWGEDGEAVQLENAQA
jgi:hypothetical protein